LPIDSQDICPYTDFLDVWANELFPAGVLDQGLHAFGLGTGRCGLVHCVFDAVAILRCEGYRILVFEFGLGASYRAGFLFAFAARNMMCLIS